MEVKLVVLIHTLNTMAQLVLSLAMLVSFLLALQGGSAWKTRLGVDLSRLAEVRNVLTSLPTVERCCNLQKPHFYIWNLGHEFSVMNVFTLWSVLKKRNLTKVAEFSPNCTNRSYEPKKK